MKRFLLTAFLLLGLVEWSRATPGSGYTNNGIISVVCPPGAPPQVDATNFNNIGTFDVTFAVQLSPFDFSDVLYYTNRGTMTCNTGFIFNDSPYAGGTASMSAIFGNGNQGTILAGSASNNFSAYVSSSPLLQVSATNIINTGLLDVGTSGNLMVGGMGVNLSRGTLHIEGLDDAFILTNFSSGNLGINENYWGIGTQTNELGLYDLKLPDPFSPGEKVTTASYQQSFRTVAPTNAAVFVLSYGVSASNNFYQLVYVNTNLPGISTAVRFEADNNLSDPVIQWQAIVTNTYGKAGQTVVTNNLYLTDAFGAIQTNYLVTNSYTQSGATLFAPFNYTFSRSFPGFTNLTAANTTFDPQTIFLNAFPATNAYSAYGVTLAPVTYFPDPTLPDSSVTNTPGRIQINAGISLDLTSASVTGPNYLNLTSTNHYVGSAGATIIAPYVDVNLGTTNGLLTVSNLVAPDIARFTGPIDMYSARWTNVTAGITNEYHVLIVNAALAPTSPPLLLNCLLRSTNVYISDVLNISNSLYVNAQNLTITSNSPGAANPYGEINLMPANILWSSSFPVLQSFTNFGFISASNSIYFYATSNSPYYTPSSGLFSSFVNRGIITSAGDSIGANYFENTGVGTVFTNLGYTNSALIYSSIGSVNIQASTALMGNASILAPAGDFNLTTGSLTITNHPLQVSGALNFAVSNRLTDGGAASSNFWSAGDGMSLFVKPVTGDFLGTTVTLTAPIGNQVFNTWAGLDQGPVVQGFLNNGAIGHLILNGGDVTSQFVFSGPDATNQYAIYVDQLDLRGGTAQQTPVGTGTNEVEYFNGMAAASNFKIYFADAVVSNFDISEKLNGANGGILVWVPSYAGIFSSTNLVYPAGVTNKFNRALVGSTDIDSNGNGSANAFDPMPIYTSYDVNLTVSLTNLPPKAPLLQWSGLANSTNIVFFKTNLANTNWTVLTNFVFGPVNGVATVIDRGRTNGAAYYKVQVIAPLP